MHSGARALFGVQLGFCPKLLAVVLLLVAMPTLAQQAGRVIISAGVVQATPDGGSSRDLARGDAVDVGDTITTDAAGRTQIRFIDGGLVSLRPNTEYHLDDFSFEPGQERQAATLRRGALTTLTGGAARKARDRYRLSTPLATIGVRGTHYEVALASSGELYLGVSEGAIRATATHSAGAEPGFADLGVNEDYRFAMFRPDGSISLLAERPQLLESLSRVGPRRDGAANERSRREGSAGNDGAGRDRDAGTAGPDHEAGTSDRKGAVDRLGDALGGDLRKPGTSSFPALQPGDGPKPGIGGLPGSGVDPGSHSGKGSGRLTPLDGINPIRGTLAPLERGDVTVDRLRASQPPR